MPPFEQFRARIVWLHVLSQAAVSPHIWQDWADERLREIDSDVPLWLCELATAPDAMSALRSVGTNIGLERRNFPDSPVDETSLAFGVAYFRYAANNDRALEAVQAMTPFADIHEYVDGGHWRRYQNNPDIDLRGMNLEASMSLVFRPVAAYALRTLRQVLGGKVARAYDSRHAMSEALVLIERIRVEFGSVAFPMHCGLRAAMAKDDWITDEKVLAQITQTEDFIGKWWDVPVGELQECTMALNYLDAHGIEFYLPAYMSAVLRYPASFDNRTRSGSWTVISTFCPDDVDPDLRELFMTCFPRITGEKKRVCREFLEYVAVCTYYHEGTRKLASKALADEYWRND